MLLCLQTSLALFAPAAGVIEELLVPDGGKVEAGQQLYKLRVTGQFTGYRSGHLWPFQITVTGQFTCVSTHTHTFQFQFKLCHY